MVYQPFSKAPRARAGGLWLTIESGRETWYVIGSGVPLHATIGRLGSVEDIYVYHLVNVCACALSCVCVVCVVCVCVCMWCMCMVYVYVSVRCDLVRLWVRALTCGVMCVCAHVLP